MRYETFERQMDILSHAFRKPLLKKQQLEVYWKYLQTIDDDSFIETCSKIIRTERFFPAISVFLNLNSNVPEWY